MEIKSIFDIFVPKEDKSDETDAGIFLSIPPVGDVIRRKRKKKKKKAISNEKN